MTLSARLAAGFVALAFLAAWSAPALACSCDKEARIKKYGTLKLVHESAPPSVPPSSPAAPVVLPPAPSSPGS